jgi:ribosomal protein S18 acetylase RimI-like enzyme
VGYEAKWLADTFEYHHTPLIMPAPLPKRLSRRIRDLAIASCRTLGCFDYCRVDFRLDKAGNPYVLEVNANPDISPDAGFAAALEAAGISYEAFVKLTVKNAERRKRNEPRSTIQASSFVPHPSSIVSRIRWCRREDRQTVLTFLAQTGFFRPDEMDIAREVLDDALAAGPKGHYQSFVACMGKEVVGWVCFGPTPCTIGSFDIYWIGVACPWQGRGVGRALMDFAEQAISQRGGRLSVIETSSREKYLPTRRFYEALGYTEAAQIPEFYGPEDHKVIFTKALRHTP